MWSEYLSVASLDEAIVALALHGERARIIAGGTDILIELEQGSRSGVDTLIDITRVPGLDLITRENGHFRLGAAGNAQPRRRLISIGCGRAPLGAGELGSRRAANSQPRHCHR